MTSPFSIIPMKRLLPLLILLIALPTMSWSADLVKGVRAYLNRDYATALREFRPLAEQGLPDAQFLLGGLYDNGEGVPQDHQEAVKWFRLAAEQGLAEAQTELGLRYYDGQGVPQDYQAAVKWFRRAAEQGHAETQFNLGAMYFSGKGVPRDYARAHMWFSIAESLGDEDAGKKREIIETKMSRSQIAEAQRLAREWTPKGK